MVNRDIDDLVRDARNNADKALYPHLKPHIFGPFEGDCFAYLSEVKFRLREAGFEQAKLCTDRGNQPPDGSTKQEKKEFWWNESKNFLENADVAIFLFLTDKFDRPNLPDRALDEARDSVGGRELNSSVVGEFFYWIEKREIPDRGMVIFEGDSYREIGSLIPGLAGVSGTITENINTGEIDITSKLVNSQCRNWAMGEMRNVLQDRYF